MLSALNWIDEAKRRSTLVCWGDTERALRKEEPMATDQEKLSYLDEHISYQVIMLNYTFMRTTTFKPSTQEEELDWNGFVGVVRRPRSELNRFFFEEGARG